MPNFVPERKYKQKRRKNEPTTDRLNFPVFLLPIFSCFTLFHALRKQIFKKIVQI